MGAATASKSLDKKSNSFTKLFKGAAYGMMFAFSKKKRED